MGEHIYKFITVQPCELEEPEVKVIASTLLLRLAVLLR